MYLKGKILEHMKETRKKEIIVERFEAKLKEESEMLAMEAQRANEMRQRQRGQRSKVSSRSRGVRLSLPSPIICAATNRTIAPLIPLAASSHLPPPT